MAENFIEIENRILAGKELSDDDKAFVVNKVDDYWKNHPDVVYNFPKWKKILAWIAGYQYIDYNTVKRELQPVPYIKRKITVNRLKPILRQMLAKIKTTIPELGVVPNTREYEDISAAKLGDQLLEALSNKIKFQRIRKDFFSWLLTLGRSCIRVFWDETQEGIVSYERVIDKETGEYKLEVVKAPGEVGMEVISPFNYRHDPLFSSPEKWRWFLFGEIVDRDKLAEAYNVDVETLSQEEDTSLDILYAQPFDITRDETDLVGVGGIESSQKENSCFRYELWTPNIFIIVGGGQVLDYGINADNIIPFFTYEDKLIPFELHEKGITLNSSIFKDLLPIQKEYNRFVSNLSSTIERASKIKVMTPLGSLLNKKQIFDDGSVVAIDYNPQYGHPTQLKLDTTSPEAMAFKQELEREMENVSGVHEVSFGRLPERASHASGTLVNLLLEQDDSLIDPLIKEADESVFSPAWSYLLKLVQDNYNEPRILKMVGRDKEDAVLPFRSADLRDNTDVFVSTNVSLPKSRALRTEWIIRIAQMGLIQDPKTILELLEFSDAKRVYEDELVHEKRASEENQKIEAGLILTEQDALKMIYILDDDTTHLKIHLRDRLSSKFEKYNSLQQSVLELHIQAHLQKLQAAQQQQQAMPQLPTQQEGQSAPSQQPTSEEIPGQPPVPGQAAPGIEGSTESEEY